MQNAQNINNTNDKSVNFAKKILKVFLFFILASFTLVSLTACGFHLRGYGQLNKTWQNNIYLDGQYSDGFSKSLAQHLNLQNVKIDNASNFWLTIKKEELTETSRTINTKGQIREIIFNYKITFLLRLKTEDKLLITPRTLQISRDMAINDQLVHAKEYEKNNIINNMREELVIQIIQQLNKI